MTKKKHSNKKKNGEYEMARCSMCQEDNHELKKCPGCPIKTVCDKCLFQCTTCSDIHCYGCSEGSICEKCTDPVCDSCYCYCEDCDRDYCNGCADIHSCEPVSENISDDEDLSYKHEDISDSDDSDDSSFQFDSEHESDTDLNTDNTIIRIKKTPSVIVID